MYPPRPRVSAHLHIPRKDSRSSQGNTSSGGVSPYLRRVYHRNSAHPRTSLVSLNQWFSFSKGVWETNILIFIWEDSSVSHKLSLKRLKKRAWWPINSINLSALGNFGREQLFPKDCYCLMRSVTTHPLCGINMAPCWPPKACWQLVVMMLTHFNTLEMF